MLRTESEPQLLEKAFSPSFGFDLVPSGNIINEKPLSTFFEPCVITFLRLLYFFDLLRCIGFKHAKAQPKKGIKRSSFFIMLADGIHKVCRKNDSHAL